jgi:hypothetical protein
MIVKERNSMNITNDCKPLKHKFQKVGQCFCGKYHMDKTGRMFRSKHYTLYDNPMVTGVYKYVMKYLIK